MQSPYLSFLAVIRFLNVVVQTCCNSIATFFPYYYSSTAQSYHNDTYVLNMVAVAFGSDPNSGS